MFVQGFSRTLLTTKLVVIGVLLALDWDIISTLNEGNPGLCGFGTNAMLCCYAMPSSPSESDPPLPRKIGSIEFYSWEALNASSEAARIFGEEFVGIEENSTPSMQILRRYPELQGRPYLIVYVQNKRRFGVTQQRKHWDGKIIELGERVWKLWPNLGVLEYRMYYRGKLTYWFYISATKVAAQKGIERRVVDLIRYSECL